MPLIKSWLPSANVPECPFPLNNLPYGCFSKHEADGPRYNGVAIGDCVLDVSAMEADGHVELSLLPVFANGDWCDFMKLGPDAWGELREWLIRGLGETSLERAIFEPYLISLRDITLHMPFTVNEYTDFYAGRHHATNVGTMFRGAENALPPNWLHMPIGYNGRASSVVVSGTDIVRPNGQTKAQDEVLPKWGPSERLDIELEMGAVVGSGSKLGQPVSVAEANEMIFGYVLLNDWSARDIQAWEYQPLGPFQAKAFATTISPWIVTKAALEPFRTSTPKREMELLPYLREPGPMLYDIELSASLKPEGAARSTRLCRTNYGEMYYSAAQQLAHHAGSGCAMRPGDLLGSGTISGATKDSRGSLLEMTWGGQEPLTLETGEMRRFLEDGDTVTLDGYAQGDGYRIGFGECTGTILPAVNFAREGVER